jgi:four helix bundle protein
MRISGQWPVAGGQKKRAPAMVETVRGDPAMQIRKYQELIAWQKAIALVTEIYSQTSAFPQHEIYGLTSQLRRAAVSIPSNIAEGQGRATKGEFIQFLCHARGSLHEVETQVVIAKNLEYLNAERQELLLQALGELGRILNGLITSLQRKQPSQQQGARSSLATGH